MQQGATRLGHMVDKDAARTTSTPLHWAGITIR